MSITFKKKVDYIFPRLNKKLKKTNSSWALLDEWKVDYYIEVIGEPGIDTTYSMRGKGALQFEAMVNELFNLIELIGNNILTKKEYPLPKVNLNFCCGFFINSVGLIYSDEIFNNGFDRHRKWAFDKDTKFKGWDNE